MSKTKFLGIPEGGKRAGWIEMEGGGSAGGGGNDREFIIDAIMDYHGQLTADKTYDEILAALQSGKVAIAYMTTPDGYRRKSAGWGDSEGGIGFLILSNTLDSPVTITCSPDNEWYSS